MSVIASRRQLEAAQAYQQGDARRAQALIDQNVTELQAAAAAAPAPAATAILNQVQAYESTKKAFVAAKPKSDEGNAAAKAATKRDFDNMARSAF
jgi:Ca-activated chloride channel homolog